MNLTPQQTVTVHEWAGRCVVKIEPYWCDIQRATIEYEVTHTVELEKFGVEHHSAESLVSEALELLSQNEGVMERVARFLSDAWFEDGFTVDIHKEDIFPPIVPFATKYSTNRLYVERTFTYPDLIQEALSAGMTIQQIMGVEVG